MHWRRISLTGMTGTSVHELRPQGPLAKCLMNFLLRNESHACADAFHDSWGSQAAIGIVHAICHFTFCASELLAGLPFGDWPLP